MFRQLFLKMDEDPNASGGSNTLLTGDPSKGTPDPAKVDDPAKGTPDPAKAADPAKGATDWRAGLPQELQDDASLKKFTSVEALAGAYRNAQKMIGAGKIAIPTKHSTEEDWNNVYKQLGLPEKIEEYSVNFKDGISIEENFSKEFKALAHKSGILPKQAQALADWFSDINLQSEAKVQEEIKKSFDAGVANLKKDWGNSFELNLGRANRVLSEVGGKELSDLILKKGLGGDEHVVRLLAKVGEQMYKGHKFVEGEGTGATMSNQELDAEIRKLQMDGAYTDGKHPNHKAIVAEVASLYAKRYPSNVDKN